MGEVFRQPKLTLKAGESRLMQIPVYFPIRSGKFSLRADAGGKYPKGQNYHKSDINIRFQEFLMHRS